MNKGFEMRIHNFAEQMYEEGYNAGTFDRSPEIQKAYERGLNDAWECAKKIELCPEDGGITYKTLREIFGECSSHILIEYSASEAIARIKEYEEKPADEIRIGDEIEGIEGLNIGKRFEMTKEEIVKLAVDNDLVEEVYDTLHFIVMAKLGNLRDRVNVANAELRIIKKFADANKLDVIKDIMAEESEDENEN